MSLGGYVTPPLGRDRGGLTKLMGPPGNRGSWGHCVLAQTQKSL
ncbi:unnamed protein product [Staurois parvus]|uniref:Uncharacterized protein n=1 Tax=Staurois parvus TaxID=386267 RepID=A0ABN9DAX7_9NEOB|nr:unnamed protein product [Staurois parvus]